MTNWPLNNLITLGFIYQFPSPGTSERQNKVETVVLGKCGRELQNSIRKDRRLTGVHLHDQISWICKTWNGTVFVGQATSKTQRENFYHCKFVHICLFALFLIKFFRLLVFCRVFLTHLMFQITDDMYQYCKSTKGNQHKVMPVVIFRYFLIFTSKTISN